ncbi:MAG: DUF2911 domain-containing protein [Cyclobacteriaceae bacterium]
MKTITRFRTLCCSDLAIYYIIACLVLVGTGCSQSPEKRPSPIRLDSGQVGSAQLKIEYSSPRVRGRKIFGLGDSYLVQYSEIWRTGANEATILSSSEDIRLDTFLLPKGKYSLFTIPGPKSWEVIINKEWDQWGAYYRKDSLDIIRLIVPAETQTSNEENMEFNFDNNALNFKWEKVSWSIPINSI